MNIVLDASVAVRTLLSAGKEDKTLRERVHGAECHAPRLIDAEVGSVLRRRAAFGAIEMASAAAALHALGDLVTEPYPHTSLVRMAWALPDNLTPTTSPSTSPSRPASATRSSQPTPASPGRRGSRARSS